MNYDDLKAAWQTQTLTDLDRLIAAKRQAHQAVQLVGAVGRNLLPHHPWDIFGNMEWLSEQEMFAGWTLPGRFECRAALHPATMILHLLTPQGRSFANFELAGKTFEEGFYWLKSAITAFGIDASAVKKEFPYEIPAYLTGSGTAFDLADAEAFSDFARTFSNAELIMRHVGDLHALWQHVRIWPHHFDISSRRRFQKGDGFWHMGTGYSPGDDHNYAQPYWHLTRYPNDDVDQAKLPELSGKLRWHREKWLGVILLWEDIVAEKEGSAQLDHVLNFVNAGMSALEGAG